MNENELLLNIVSQDLYNQNPFRILGLNVNASAKEVNKKRKDLEYRLDLGIGKQNDNSEILPLKSSLNKEKIKEKIKKAAEDIKDPNVRIIYELFWFWPLRDSGDKGLELLRGHKFNDALNYWKEVETQSNRIGIVAKHNIAILYHLTAIESEEDKILKNRATEKEVNCCNSHWKSALLRWNTLVCDKVFWRIVEERIQELEDPRITIETAKNLRQELPRALLGINGKFATKNLNCQGLKSVQRQMQIMQESGFDNKIIQQVLYDITKPISEQIQLSCSCTKEQAEESPHTANTIVRTFITDNKSLIDTLNILIPDDLSIRGRCCDETASALRECIVIYGNKTADWNECLELSREIKNIAVSSSLEDRINDDINFIEKNIINTTEQKKAEEEYKLSINSDAVYEVTVLGDRIAVPPLCTCCLKEANEQQGVSYSWKEGQVERTMSFNFPVCTKCEKHQDDLTLKKYLLVIVSAGISVGLLYLIGSQLKRLEYFQYIVPGTIVSFVILWILSYLIRVQVLTDEHSSRNKAVVMINANTDLNVAKFRFSNYLYALAFAKANNREVEKKKFLKDSRKCSLLHGRSALHVFIGVAILSIVGHSISFGILEDNLRPKSSYSSSSYRNTSIPSQSRSYSQSEEGDSLLSQINFGKQTLKEIGSELEEMDSNLKSLSSRIDSLKITIEKYESDAKNGQNINQYSYSSTIDSHNKLVTEYNGILEKRKTKYSEYEKEFKRENDLVDKYNNRSF